MNETNFYPETERIRIYPLSHSEIKDYLKNDFSLELKLGTEKVKRFIPDYFREVIEKVILPATITAGTDYRYFTLWLIIDKQKNILTGDLCFKGKPGETGEIEVGYGTYPDFESQGYMSEGLKACLMWAAIQPNVRAVIAETKDDNIPSHRVLQKNGFTIYAQVESMLWWRHDF